MIVAPYVLKLIRLSLIQPNTRRIEGCAPPLSMQLALVGSHASLPSKVYWQSVLPNTPMPKALQDSLISSIGQIQIPTPYPFFFSSSPTSSPLALVGSHASLPSKVYWQSVLPNTPMPKALQDSLISSIDTRFNHPNGLSNKKLEGRGTVDTTFFIETDLRPGKKMKLHFSTANGATFLPHQVAKSVPFSSDKLLEILNLFSVIDKSEEAKVIKSTIVTCETKCVDREGGLCATSLESLVDFSVSKLGKNVQVLSTQVPKETEKQEYRITGVHRINANKGVVCHKQNYVYAVFYCHEIHDAGTYMVPLVSSDGTKVNAIAACQADAFVGNAFNVLKVKPGTVPICHFLDGDSLLWVPN
nr:burp domain protein rd22 [Quercus suber]